MTKPLGKVSAEILRTNFFVAPVTHRTNPSKKAVHRNTVGLLRERDKTSTSKRRGAERPCYLVIVVICFNRYDFNEKMTLKKLTKDCQM